MKCAVLKVRKPAWTNGDPGELANESGIFFSVWVEGGRDLSEGKAFYNIHALKLRELKAYRLKSREVARRFREKFEGMKGEWPNMRMDFGPQTWMQGWVEIEKKGFIGEVRGLVRRFAEEVGPVIDGIVEG